MHLLQLHTISQFSRRENTNYISGKHLFMLKIFAALLTLIFVSNTVNAGEIYSTGFESGNRQNSNGFTWGSGKRTDVSSEKSKTGNYSLKFRFPAVGSEGNKYSDAEQRFKLGGHYPELWIKYDLYIPQNYYHRNSGGPTTYNNKFLMLWAGSYQPDNREGPLIGAHYWPRSDGSSNVNAFASATVNGKIVFNGKHWNCSACGSGDGADSNGITKDDLGHWMTIVLHVKYASKSNNDGVYELWKTNWRGETNKLFNIHDGPWYATMPNSTQAARGFDQGYLLGWANSGFVNETVLYIDNITFSTTPLSSNYVPDNTANPKPPKPLNQ